MINNFWNIILPWLIVRNMNNDQNNTFNESENDGDNTIW